MPKHGRHEHGAALRGWLKAVGLVAAIAVASAASIAAVSVWDLSKQIVDNSIDISSPNDETPPDIGQISGSFNLLVVGIDNDVDQAEAFGERDATLNDVNILLHVSADHTSATVVSIPRDLITDQPACTNTTTGDTTSALTGVSFNTAFARGGLACVVNTAEELTGLDIPYAAQMSFNAVVQMTDAVGGVSVCLADPIKDDYSGLDLPAGTSVISGGTALAFLRTRHGVGDGSDLSRISSQQVYMSSLVRRLKSDDTLTDITKLYALANVAATNVRLSTSLTSLDTMVSMAQTLRTVDLATMALVQYPGTTEDPDYPGKVVPTTDVADELFAAIEADQPLNLASDSLGTGSTLDPNAAVETPATNADGTPATNADGTPATATADPDATVGPGAISGLQGQTAQQETCSVGFGS
ncbi:MAG: hypothetical protein JWQ43_2498 [Glaciihabitans sp.]|nr:hypothetical protein [Glaciihabitans sp.]